jgi:hypothetical protein
MNYYVFVYREENGIKEILSGGPYSSWDAGEIVRNYDGDFYFCWMEECESGAVPN